MKLKPPHFPSTLRGILHQGAHGRGHVQRSAPALLRLTLRGSRPRAARRGRRGPLGESSGPPWHSVRSDRPVMSSCKHIAGFLPLPCCDSTSLVHHGVGFPGGVQVSCTFRPREDAGRHSVKTMACCPDIDCSDLIQVLQDCCQHTMGVGQSRNQRRPRTRLASSPLLRKQAVVAAYVSNLA